MRFPSWAVITLMLPVAACVRLRPSVPPAPKLMAAEPPAPQPAKESQLYSAEQALRDVLSGELEYIGTGSWPGVERMRACAFRNQRVLVVNAYCTLYETPAFRLDVYSPEHGRVRIYAETRGVVSQRARGEYFTFMVESSPPASASAQLPELKLTMPYEELRRYEQQRYEAYLPSCFGGEQNERPVGNCLGALAASHADWAAEHRAFLEQANDDWYFVVRKLRELASRYGVQPAN